MNFVALLVKVRNYLIQKHNCFSVNIAKRCSSVILQIIFLVEKIQVRDINRTWQTKKDLGIYCEEGNIYIEVL